jgi:hypothetical protein
MFLRLVLAAPLALLAIPAAAADRATIDALVTQHAGAHGVPVALVHRVIRRESSYNPRAVSRGNFGLMQIRHDTARGMGYRGSASGLLDAGTNLTYAVPYLANAYKVAGGNHDRAVAFYSRGYYYEAKRRGMLGQLRTGASTREPEVIAVVTPVPQEPPSLLSVLFGVQPAQSPAVQEAAADLESRPPEARLEVGHGRVRRARTSQRMTTVVQRRSGPALKRAVAGDPVTRSGSF